MQDTVVYPYFPTTYQAVIFRNWGSVEAGRIAKTIQTTEEIVRRCAEEMGLDPDEPVKPIWQTRGYVTIIRQNWYLLPQEQILTLLDWTAEKFAFSMKEDDFLYYKLGRVPTCEKVVYAPLTAEQKERTAWLRDVVRRAAQNGKQDAFAFLDELREPEHLALAAARKAESGEVCLDASWGIAIEAFEEDVRFIAERFVRRMRERWGITLDGMEHKIILRSMPKGKQRRETHTVTVRDGKVTIESVDAFGLMRGLTYLENRFETAGAPVLTCGTITRNPRFETRVIYPYSSVFGDVFDSADFLDEGLLDRLMSAGVNGIWLHAVLYQLVEFPFDRSLSVGWEKRNQVLCELVRRAKRYGIRIYLYLNEPRGMPNAFFEKYPELAGTTQGDLTCLCTSTPAVQAYLHDGVKTLFTNCNDLGGIFTITMSENLTNCYSNAGQCNCTRCASRTAYDVAGEVNRLMEAGMHEAAPDAELFVYAWAWQESCGYPEDKFDDAVAALPHNAWLLSVSETKRKIKIGGVEGKVSDYSISIPGPSEFSKKIWQSGKKYHMPTAAKVQVNNSWEMSATPYLPVYDLVSEHFDNLIAEDVSALFLSWSLGGYPTENLKLISKRFWSDDTAEGKKTPARKAQSIFSEAFRHFPFSVQALYYAPQNIGPANPLLLEPSGFDASMVCFPHDHLKKWRAPYPEDVFENQFAMLCKRWKEGLDYLEQTAPEETELLNISRAAYNHFKSAHLQIQFVRRRDAGHKDKVLADLAREELALVYSQIACCAEDSRIGFEASNHYFYTQQTLLEAAVSCEYVMEQL